jgi:hypothetical protein
MKKPTILAIICIAVFISPAAASADEFDDILITLAERRSAQADLLEHEIPLLERAKLLNAICESADRESVIKPFIRSSTYMIELLNKTISSVDAYIRLYNLVSTSGNIEDKNALTQVFAIYDELSAYLVEIVFENSQLSQELFQLALNKYSFRLY